MKRLTLFLCLISICTKIVAQPTRVAILDFENISGIAKYDGLGKAMSSMLITDIEANVSPKRLQLVERSQIQKILKEQNFQASSAVDKASSVKAGKLLGVKYLLVGDIYILNDVLVINARLTDTETGDIKFSKKQEGKLTGWLALKTNVAKELAKSISMPFTEPNIPDEEINVATITSFGNALVAKDNGNVVKAEELINTIQEFSPNFKYVEDLKVEIDQLKKDIEILKKSVDEAVENPYDLGLDYYYKSEYKLGVKYLKIAQNRLSSTPSKRLNKQLFSDYFMGCCFIELGQFSEADSLFVNCTKTFPDFVLPKIARLRVLILTKKKEEFDIQLSALIEEIGAIQKSNNYYFNTVAYDYFEYGNGKDGVGNVITDGGSQSDLLLCSHNLPIIFDDLARTFYEIQDYNQAFLMQRKAFRPFYDRNSQIDRELEGNLIQSLSWYYLKAKEYKESQKLFHETFKNRPVRHNYGCFINFAHAFALDGNTDMAQKLYCITVQENKINQWHPDIINLLNDDQFELGIDQRKFKYTCSESILFFKEDSIEYYSNLNTDKLLNTKEKISYDLVVNGNVSPWTLIFDNGGKCKIKFHDKEINLVAEKSEENTSCIFLKFSNTMMTLVDEPFPGIFWNDQEIRLNIGRDFDKFYFLKTDGNEPQELYFQRK
jgi:TolB-like protein